MPFSGSAIGLDPRSVSAIVVSYWTGAALAECLASLLQQPEIREIIIVNNGNDIETIDLIKKIQLSSNIIRVVDPGKNVGFSVGCNYGVRFSRGNYIALINPDLVLAPGSIRQFLDVFKTHPKAWLLGGRLEHPDGSEQRGGRREILSPWRALVELARLDRFFPNHPYFRRLHLHEDETVREICEVPTVSGAFMVIPRRLYQRLGGMDDHMFMHFEDADLCIRVRQQGGQVLYCGHIPVKHYLSTSDVSKLFIEWHKTRSTSYYFSKHFTATYPTWTLRIVSSLLWARFIFLSALLLAHDIPGILRRWRRDARHVSPHATHKEWMERKSSAISPDAPISHPLT